MGNTPALEVIALVFGAMIFRGREGITRQLGPNHTMGTNGEIE